MPHVGNWSFHICSLFCIGIFTCPPLWHRWSTTEGGSPRPAHSWLFIFDGREQSNLHLTALTAWLHKMFDILFFGNHWLGGLTATDSNTTLADCIIFHNHPQSRYLVSSPCTGNAFLHFMAGLSTGREEHCMNFWDQPCAESGRVLGAACGQLTAREHATSRQQDRFHQNHDILGQTWSEFRSCGCSFANVPKEPAESPNPSGDAALLCEPKFNLWVSAGRQGIRRKQRIDLQHG